MSLERPISARVAGSETDEASFQKIAGIVHGECGIVLSANKRNLIQSRLMRRLKSLGCVNLAQYCDLLQEDHDKSELRQLISLLTTNVTRFFREDHHFHALKKDVLPDLISQARRGRPVRIWSAGCSSGEEPYSIAMTVLDQFPDAGRFDFRILATDIDPEMIRTGSSAIYRAAEVEKLPKDISSKYFTKNEGFNAGYQLSEPVRSLVTFAELNLLADWPMKGQFDVIFCRNVVIYFDADTQAKLWRRFASLLKPGGELFLGHSERVSGPATGQLHSKGVTQYQNFPHGNTELKRKTP